jgi:hypothetical protein
MARHNDRQQYTTTPENSKETSKLSNRHGNSLRVAAGPAFVVWLSHPGRKLRGFITWSETAVAELSPNIRDAWHFPSAKAASDSVARSFGPMVEGFSVAVFPTRI